MHLGISSLKLLCKKSIKQCLRKFRTVETTPAVDGKLVCGGADSFSVLVLGGSSSLHVHVSMVGDALTLSLCLFHFLVCIIHFFFKNMYLLDNLFPSFQFFLWSFLKLTDHIYRQKKLLATHNESQLAILRQIDLGSWEQC